MKNLQRFAIILKSLLIMIVVSSDVLSPRYTIAANTLFPRNLAQSEWVEFMADGFEQPVTGVIYTPATAPCCGVPLGGVATGCIDIDTRGVWGYSSIFNGWDDFFYIPDGRVPRMNPEIEPILGLAVNNQVWALTTQQFIHGAEAPWCTEPHYPGVWTSDPEPRVKKLKTLNLRNVKPANNIYYWGHFPIADMEFETDAPVQVSMRAWSSFLPGNAVTSNIPAAVFEVRLNNTTATVQSGTLAFNFPGPNPREARSTDFLRKEVHGDFNGLVISTPADISYAVGVIGKENLRLGAGLNAHPDAWSQLGSQLPEPVFRSINDSQYYQTGSATAAVDFSLKADEQKIIRFVLAWYAPVWEGARKKHAGAQPEKTWLAPDWMGETCFYKPMYATRYVSALDAAMRIAADHEKLLNRILAWQNVIYQQKTLPGWLKDALINNLSLIAENGYWTQPLTPLGDWAYPHGVFAMNESSRGCPHIGNIPCDWYGTLPITFFYPDLAHTTLKAFKQYQRPTGESPFALGRIHGLPDFTTPEYYWQKSLNSVCYVDLVDRLWQRTGDESILKEFYESVKKATVYTMGLSTKPAAPIRMPDDGGMEWFEHGEWAGMATHMGGLRLAMLRMSARMADKLDDRSFAQQCAQWLADGQDAMENKMWTDNGGGYYLNFWEPETGKKSEDVMAYQLDGQWAALAHGLEGVFKPDRVTKTLATIKRVNIPLTPDVGAANFAKPGGQTLSRRTKKSQENINQVTDADIAHYGSYTMFTAEVAILGMTYMTAGEHDYGLELIRKHWYNLFCKQQHPWDYPNMVKGDTGERLFGTDYYQAMMLWAVPATLNDQDIASFSAPGNLLDQIIVAAQNE